MTDGRLTGEEVHGGVTDGLAGLAPPTGRVEGDASSALSRGGRRISAHHHATA